MAPSLRWTLAVRFCLTMGVALLGIALWAYLGMRYTLIGQLDRSLDSSFELQALVIAEKGRILSRSAPMEEESFVREINRLIVLRDSTGRIVQANTDLALDLPLDASRFRRALAGEQGASSGVWRGKALRSFVGPAPAAVSPARVLEVAAALGPLDAASRTVLYRMIATAMLGALASLVGAGWLARSALTPVQEIANQAQAIQGGASGQRITAHADVTELQGLVEVLNQMVGRLERSYEWHRRIVRDLSHDLRTPITTMRAGVEVALWTERKPDEYRQVLANTLEEIDRLVLIGDALSLLAKLESGEFEPTRARADVRLLVSQAVDRARARPGGHNVRYVQPPPPLPAEVDARLLGMVLDQLLDNARRHTPPDTPVEVTAVAQEGRVTLTVEDHGPGVPEEMIPHLFDRFYRGDSARGRQAGPGLGLTLAAAIVEMHHGRIEAERATSGGLRIRIDIPIRAVPLRADSRAILLE